MSVSFNSRTHEGCDSITPVSPKRLETFQFTHPRGVRPDGKGRRHPVYRFNSRTHEGCDKNARDYARLNAEFQFTHPRGVRRQPQQTKQGQGQVSIHAPTRGATPTYATSWRGSTRFNSRTHEGCDS